jgi:hypothetical protein
MPAARHFSASPMLGVGGHGHQRRAAAHRLLRGRGYGRWLRSRPFPACCNPSGSGRSARHAAPPAPLRRRWRRTRRRSRSSPACRPPPSGWCGCLRPPARGTGVPRRARAGATMRRWRCAARGAGPRSQRRRRCLPRRRLQRGGMAADAMVKTKVVPSPAALVHADVVRPAASSTSCLQIARPRPVPPIAAGGATGRAAHRPRTGAAALRIHADAGVAHFKAQATGCHRAH